MEYLAKAEKADPRLPSLHQQIGLTYLRMNQIDKSEQAYLKALEIDPESAAAHNGLSQVYFRQRHFENAAMSALNAVGLTYHYPLAHYNRTIPTRSIRPLISHLVCLKRLMFD